MDPIPRASMLAPVNNFKAAISNPEGTFEDIHNSFDELKWSTFGEQFQKNPNNNFLNLVKDTPKNNKFWNQFLYENPWLTPSPSPQTPSPSPSPQFRIIPRNRRVMGESVNRFASPYIVPRDTRVRGTRMADAGIAPRGTAARLEKEAIEQKRIADEKEEADARDAGGQVYADYLKTHPPKSKWNPMNWIYRAGKKSKKLKKQKKQMKQKKSKKQRKQRKSRKN